MLECSICEKKNQATFFYRIKSFPRILIVHMKRFDWEGNKRAHNVAYPNEFSFRSRYLSDDLKHKEKHGYQNSPNDPLIKRVHTYKLYGFIIHKGKTTAQGHYYAVVRHNQIEGAWLKFDDHVVTEIKDDEKFQKECRQAYILFYYRRWNYPIHQTL